VVLATINANGGDNDLILVIKIFGKDFGRLRYDEVISKKEEIPAILADDGISLKRVSANFCCA
jgi:hypothetical protein